MLGPEDTVARRLFRGVYLHFDIENDYQWVDIRREMVRIRHEDWFMWTGKLVSRLNNSGADLQPYSIYVPVQARALSACEPPSQFRQGDLQNYPDTTKFDHHIYDLSTATSTIELYR